MKIFTGTVVSKKMQKTVTAEVERVVVHPIYKKRFKRTKKYQIHDEAEIARVGQQIKFVACKPYSKSKRWKIVEAAESAKAPEKKEVKPKRKISGKGK